MLPIDVSRTAPPVGRASRARRTLLPLVLVLLALVPAVAHAHPGLSRSTPAEGARLASAPGEFKLTFTEAIERALARVRLVGPGGVVVPLSSLRQPTDSAQVLFGTIEGPMPVGAYTLEWQIVGADGHAVDGTVSFSVEGPPAASVPTSAPSHHDPASMPGSEGFTSTSLGYVVVRWLHLTTLIVLIGVAMFVLAILPRIAGADETPQVIARMRSQAAAVGLWVSIGFAVTVALRLHAQTLSLQGPGDAFDAGLFGAMLLETLWGKAWIAQAIAAGVAVYGFRQVRRGRRAGWGVASAAIAALAFTPALSGHAAASPTYRVLAILADGLHVIGAGGWLGALLLLVVVGLPAATRAPDGWQHLVVARLVSAFSPAALVFASVVGATGLLATWLHLGFTAAIWESEYGRMLLLKLAVLGAVVGTGAYNWRKVRPRLGNAAGTRRLRQSAAVELTVALALLLVTAVLVATPPPMDAATDSATEASAGLNARSGVP